MSPSGMERPGQRDRMKTAVVGGDPLMNLEKQVGEFKVASIAWGAHTEEDAARLMDTSNAGGWQLAAFSATPPSPSGVLGGKLWFVFRKTNTNPAP